MDASGPLSSSTDDAGSTVPSGWRKKWSEAWKRHFFVHDATNESVWNLPNHALGTLAKEAAEAINFDTNGELKPIPTFVQNKLRELTTLKFITKEQADSIDLRKGLTSITANMAIQVLEEFEDIAMSSYKCSDAVQKPIEFILCKIGKARQEAGKRRRELAAAAAADPDGVVHPGARAKINSEARNQALTTSRNLGLTSEMESYFVDNAHIRQVFITRRKFVKADRSLGEMDRFLQVDAPRSKYQRRVGEIKTVEQWGLRKLLLGDMEFILNHGEDGMTVLYVGDALGSPICYLADRFFPKMKFVIIDRRGLEKNEGEGHNVFVREETFTDDTAREFAGQKVLLICDMVGPEHANVKEKDSERLATAQADMNLQKRWYDLMNPIAAMFRFRLPYPPPDASTTFLNGQLFLPVWSGKTTAETMLVVTGNEEKAYSHIEYEEMMFHFNTVVRTTYWDHDVHDAGLDHCFDCASEIFILSKYLRKMEAISDESLSQTVSALSKEITSILGKNGRKLASSV